MSSQRLPKDKQTLAIDECGGKSGEDRLAQNPRGRFWCNSLILFVLLIVAYVPVSSAEYIWDDDDYVTENVHLRTAAGLREIWLTPKATPQYYPLVFTTFWFEYQMWQLNPFGFHAVNVILHGLNALLLYRILTQLQIPGAFLAALLFTVHPVHVESVAWITERKNVLSGMFYLLAFQACWKFSTAAGDDRTGPSRWRSYLLALFCFAAALLSKSVTCTLPAAVLVLLWWKKGRLSWSDALPLLPMFILGIGSGIHTAYLEHQHVGAEGIQWNWTLRERCLIAGRCVWFYAGKLLWPHPLIFIYPRWTIVGNSWSAALFPLSALILLGGLWLGRIRWGRGPLAAALFFGGTLVPALGFINVFPMKFSFVADHFQYLASIGPIVLLAAVAAKIVDRWKLPARRIVVAITVLALTLTTLTFNRCSHFRDRETLWVSTLTANPDCWLAEYHVAVIRFDQRRYEESVALFLRVLQHEKDEEPDPLGLAVLHNQLADSYQGLGAVDSARKHFQEAIDHYRELIDDNGPDQFLVHYNIGHLHRMLGQLPEACDEFRQALRFDERNLQVRQDLGDVCYQLRRFDESAECFQQILQYDPQNVPALFGLAVVARVKGDKPVARKHLRSVLQIQPSFRQAQLLLHQLSAE